jgi:ATP:corrinoid adenosyltransferase
MTPKIWGYAGIGIVVVALIAGVLWQANQLIKVGREAGEAKAIEAGLRESLQELRDQKAKEVRELKESNENCMDHLSEIEAASNEWKAKWESIRMRPPRTVTVEIESTTWEESLVEGHGKLLVGLEGIRNEGTPYPPH